VDSLAYRPLATYAERDRAQVEIVSSRRGTQRVPPQRDQEGRNVAELSYGISEHWKKSSASHDAGCVEVRRTQSGVEVRDSKNPGGAVLEFTDKEWIAFLKGVALGEFHISGSQPPCAV
jgi:hypothetical protein